MCLVLFTPVGIAFGLVTLPWELYLLGLGLILVPLLVMEISKVIADPPPPLSAATTA